MAQAEITGASPLEREEMAEAHLDSPLYQNHGIPFETAYCLAKIGKQPDHYDGPQRFCKNRALKRDEDDYEGGRFTEQAYSHSCSNHGGYLAGVDNNEENLEEPRTAALTHGAYAEDESLKMDFTEQEQELYDSIMHDWPEIYNWPDESDDPARYRILRRVAVNEVRAMREEDYLDNHEVHVKEIPTENGVVQTEEVENPLAREYRLLMSEVTDQLKELGLTPKEQQKMDSLASQASKDDAVSEIAQDALNGSENEYDPDQFDE